MNRKEHSHYQRSIHGKNIFVIFAWNNYTPANYRADFQAYKKYLVEYYKHYPDAMSELQTSIQSFPEDHVFLETLREEIEFDLAKHPKELIEEELMAFEEFRKTTEEKVSGIIFDLFDKDETLIHSKLNDTFSVNIIVEPVKEREWYFQHFFDKGENLKHMDRDRMLYQFSGYWLLHNIFIPACHLKDKMKELHLEDAKVSILQQIKQHHDVLEGNLIDDSKLASELKDYLAPADTRNVRYLYTTVHGVWSATLSEFYATYNAKKFIVIPARAIQNYRRLLEILTTQSQNKVTAFYEQYVGYSNTGPSSEYSMGRIVGAIASAAAAEAAIEYSGKPEKKKPYDIFLNGMNDVPIDTKNPADRKKIISDAISNNQEIILGNFDPATVNQVLSTIRRERDLRRFIDYVENSFKIMNIAPQNTIFTKKMFTALIRKANERK